MPEIARSIYPFVAIVGQSEMKRSLLLNVVDPRIGGVMIMGHRGTGKSTAVRSLAAVMPTIDVVGGCPLQCPPGEEAGLCGRCIRRETRDVSRVPVPIVDLPLGVTEDRVTGSLDIEAALVEGRRSFEAGLLGRAHRGFLYIDEVNLLEDHLVDLLLDVAAAGENIVEREGISARHPARFVLVGSGNPEEGQLRPQLLDRFGLYVEVETEAEIDERLEIVRRRLAFDADPPAFVARFASESAALRDRVNEARENLSTIRMDDAVMRLVVSLARKLSVDGHRGEVVAVRAATAHAALAGRKVVESRDVAAVAPSALRHRMRRDPLEDRLAGHRVEDALDELLPGWRSLVAESGS